MSRRLSSVLARCVILACVDVITADPVQTRATPIQYQPSDNDVIYEIQTPTSQRCIYVCIQNPACVSALYRETSACLGYGNKQISDVRVDSDTKAWLIAYGGN